MTKGLFRKGCMTVGAVLALGCALPTVASASTFGLPCFMQQFSQPFLQFGDTHQYTLLWGESAGGFDGWGWTLSGGAQIVTARLADGSQRRVLDLPQGAMAVSPPLCVNESDYPQARTMVNDVSGNQGVNTYVSYDFGSPLSVGVANNPTGGWAPSSPLMLHSATLTGTHWARFTLIGATSINAGGNGKGVAAASGRGRGEYQVYNFYVDPRMHH